MTVIGIAWPVDEAQRSFWQAIQTRSRKREIEDILIQGSRRNIFRSTLAHELAVAQKPAAVTWSEALGNCDTWFKEHINPLLERHSGQYVAVASQRLLDHDVDLAALARRTRGQYGARPVLIRRVTDPAVIDRYDHFISGLR